ncbi:MAG: serine hydrolase [Caulobacteraceae bacterium]|nr:serine hydrolase [Caulobacteraceae bacterium]
MTTSPNAPAPDWLAPALAYIPRWLDYQMRSTEQPGCSLAVAWRGEVVLEAAFGHADLVAGEALTPRHRFRVASHSKSFTAAGILKLREQGRLKLDDTAGQYVSGLHPDIASATLAQLLSHSAGVVRDGPDCAYWVDRAAFLDEASLRGELAAGPAIDPNTRLKYSNHGFGLAGLIIEAVTGEPYAVWVKREIVDVAGLAETTPDVPVVPGAPLARGHSGKALLGRRLVFPGDQPTSALASATGFVSTAADLARFFAQLSPTAETRLLSAASRREMSRAQWKDRWSAIPITYGLGTIGSTFDGWEGVGHSGGFQGYLTRTSTVAAHDLTVSCLTNAIDGPAHVWLDGAMAILKRFQESGPPTPAVADWTGRWWSVWGPTDLVPAGDKVFLATPAMPNPLMKATELTPTGPDEARISQAGAFASYGEPARLVRGEDGQVAEVMIAGGRLVSEAVLAAELTGRYEG